MKPLREARREFMRAYLEGLLREAKGNRTEAATIAGLSRQHLQLLLRNCGLTRKYVWEDQIGNRAWQSLGVQS